VAALLAEHDGDLRLALKHRMIEITKIEWLHAEERRNPAGATKDYETPELNHRREMAEELAGRIRDS